MSSSGKKKVSLYNSTRKGMKYKLRKYTTIDESPPPPPMQLRKQRTIDAADKLRAHVILATKLRILEGKKKKQCDDEEQQPMDVAAAAAAAAAAAVQAAETAAAAARSRFNESHQAAAAANAAVHAAANQARAASAAVTAAQQQQHAALIAVAQAAQQPRSVSQPPPHEVHSRSLSAADQEVILAHVRSSFVAKEVSKGRWDKLVPQVEMLLTTFSVAPVMPDAVYKYFSALATAERADMRKARELPIFDRAAAEQQASLHATDLQVLRATLISIVMRRCPALLLHSVAELVAEFPDASEDAEPQRLLHFRNLLRCGVWLFGGRNHKGILLNLAGRLSGRMFTTGGGSTTETRRRERLLIQLSGVAPRKIENPRRRFITTIPNKRRQPAIVVRPSDLEVATAAAFFTAAEKGDEEDLWSELSTAPDVLQHVVCDADVFNDDAAAAAADNEAELQQLLLEFLCNDE